MENKLPNIYRNKENITSNNRRFYYSDEKYNNNDDTKKNDKDSFIKKYDLEDAVKINNINNKIINIFKTSSSIYKIKVNIIINGIKYEKYLIGRTNNSIITMDGDVIYIKDLDDIEKID